MKILFIGNFQQGPGGEAADETHLARELHDLGNDVIKVSRDEWREYVIEEYPLGKYKVPDERNGNDIHFDIAIIAKWHHFYDGRFIEAIRLKYSCPVFYWVWDSMEGHSVGDWHMNMAQSADLYLSGELGRASFYKENNVRFYYFQFDSTDIEYFRYPRFENDLLIDVMYPGSFNNQNGRIDLLKKINEKVKIKVFAHDHEEWKKNGFEAFPAVYGNAFNEMVAKSKIVLGTSCDHNCGGYWSNRIGKVLFAGGFLLQWFTPGMEQFAGRCDFFEDASEAIMKIQYYLAHPDKRETIVKNNVSSGVYEYTSSSKCSQLIVLINRYLASNKGKDWLLP